MENSTATRLQKVRDAIDALMDGGAVQSYEINGRQLSHYSLAQLMDLEKRLLAMVNSERSDQSTNFVRFEDPK
jgi:hypothetical protein